MAGYIGTTPVPQATQHRESFTATGGQTSFATVGYTPQFIDVYLNGVKLAPADFTATNGSDVVLASGATASDILEIVAYTPFEVANQTFTGTTTAANLTVTGAFTSQGIDDNANAVAITIDSSENVGIGTSSPAELLNLSAAEPVIRFTDSDDNNYHHLFSSSDDFYISADRNNTGSGNLIFRNGGTSERMRIDSSGNIFAAGKTALSDATAGHAFAGGSNAGLTYHTADSSLVMSLNRLTNDGEIIRLRKDGSTVGSIGTRSGSIGIGNGDVGLEFNASNNDIYPKNVTTNSLSDANIDLGSGSYRFKDLYLSGGVYLGGTGSANKLDRYEEGTWNLTCTAFTATSSNAFYRVIGDVCYAWFNVVGVSNVNSNAVRISLPFTSAYGAGFGSAGSVFANFNNLSPTSCWVGNSASVVDFYNSVSTNSQYTQFAGGNIYGANAASFAMYGQFQYRIP